MAGKDMKIYALYDTRDNDLCVFVGTVPEIARFLKCSSPRRITASGKDANLKNDIGQS